MKYLIKNHQKDRQTFGGEKREKPIKKDRGRKRFLRRSRKNCTFVSCGKSEDGLRRQAAEGRFPPPCQSFGSDSIYSAFSADSAAAAPGMGRSASRYTSPTICCKSFRKRSSVCRPSFVIR